MRARVRASNDLWFEADAETEEDLFKQVARIQEIFQHWILKRVNGRSKKVNLKF